MMKENIKGYTLIELISVLVIIGILGTVGLAYVSPFLNVLFFTTPQMKSEQAAHLCMKDIMDGDTSATGINNMTDVTSGDATTLSYTDCNSVQVTLSWNSSNKKLYRTISGLAKTLPLAVPQNDTLVNGAAAGVIFKYYDANNNQLSVPITTPSQIERVQFDLDFYTGTSPYLVKQYETSYLLSTGVFIRQY